MQKTKDIFFYALFIAGILISGFYRDFVFKSINALLQAWDHDMDFAMPPSLQFLKGYEYDTLVNIKWILTLAFSILYLLFALLLVNRLFHSRSYIRITLAVYAGIVIVSGLFMGYGMIDHHAAGRMYSFARYLMGMAQSPVVLMILVPAFKLAEKEKSASPQ